MNDPFLSVWLIGFIVLAIAGPIAAAITKAMGKWESFDDIDDWIMVWLFSTVFWPIVLGIAIICLLVYGIYQLSLYIANEVVLTRRKKQSLKTEQLNNKKYDKIL